MGDSMLKIGIDILWSVAIVFLVGGGIYFTVVLKGPQFRFKQMIKPLKKPSTSGVSPMESLMMALAARIGVGSLAGIALAIHIGGPGTIFWIWVSGILTAANTYVESTMAAKYQIKTKDSYEGGPAYYIDRGLHKKVLSKVYASILLFAYIAGFITIQANTITKSLDKISFLSPWIIGIFLSILTGFIIRKGIQRIAHITGKLVPIMGFGYFLLCSLILLRHFKQIPSIFLFIITSAFQPKTIGVGILSILIIGVQRGVFSTEAGLGSGAIASSTTKTETPSDSGLLQVLGIYFTIFIVCTLTAFIILTSDYQLYSWENVNGIELTRYAFQYHLGSWGNVFLLFTILTFAYSTIISGYYYGESSLKYLVKTKHPFLLPFLRIGTIFFILFGSLANPHFLWDCVDFFVAILAIINMYSLFCLRKDIKREWENQPKSKKV